MPGQNRLHLDWALNTSSERAQFVEEYIQKINFELTNDEKETISDYILWGKDSDGMNAVQKKEITIETRNKTWQRDNTESLDAMMESPTFNEASLRRPTEARTRISRETFDRDKALSECPAHMRPTFEELFRRIDKLEMAIQFYELVHGKREEEPRSSLLKQFGEDEIAAARATASKWNQFKYLKQRHLIVELRREQFTLRDQYVEKHLRHSPPEPEGEPTHLDFDAEIPVLPLGLVGAPFSDLVFKPAAQLNPHSYTEKELDKLVHFYWEKKEQPHTALYFDFGELEHVYELFSQLEELQVDAVELPVESNLRRLLDTLEYYVQLAALGDLQRDLLEMKIRKIKNQDIADAVNKKYGKTYTANYISTIFRQKIIPQINQAARFHAQIVENMCFEENFKQCKVCGRWLLIDAENFVRKVRAKDGFSNHCKNCDREERQRKKVSK